ncbi:hypothetical protein GCM10009727_58480 [Actinomadura napierensis]|uniref:NlpC/P60 domain-containing protein n=2 Tax=Actinomadura napierensis TaxID=267854 RepID=A0ABP5LV72_9ACTN
MQFLTATWASYGVDGDHDGHTDRYNPADAIYGAAHYLCANHAGQGGRHLHQAIWQYNHADWYVHKVLDQAAAYATPAPAASGRGTIAVRAALHWLGTPYSWGGGGSAGPSYGIAQGAGTKGFDCSGLTQYAWAKAGTQLHASPPPNTTPAHTSPAQARDHGWSRGHGHGLQRRVGDAREQVRLSWLPSGRGRRLTWVGGLPAG